MAVPSPFVNNSLLDDFNRADGAPSVGRPDLWDTVTVLNGAGQLTIVTNRLGSGASVGGKSRTKYGPDVDFFFTLGVLPTAAQYAAIYYNVTDVGASFDCRSLLYFPTATAQFTLRRFVNGTGTSWQTTNFTTNPVVGDIIGFSQRGNNQVVYHHIAATDVWVVFGPYTDTVNNATEGFIGFEFGDTTAKIDDLSGGTVVSISEPQIQWSDDVGLGDLGPNPLLEDAYQPIVAAAAGSNVTINMSGILATANATSTIPTLKAVITGTFARATGVGNVPAIREVIKPTPAIANAAAIVPILRARITNTPAVSNATGIVPTKIIARVVNPPAIARATALVPSIASGPVTVIAVPAIANASGITPTKLIAKISAVRAISNATAIVPVLRETAIALPAIARPAGNPGTIGVRVIALRANSAATAISPGSISVRILAIPAIARATAIRPVDPNPPPTGFSDQVNPKKIIKEPTVPTIP